uniref:Uncharacterized protein n=1 Tax=Chromera velia CCMP2878 TaxID=1169474 RepID=A0A0G4I2U2_9ALVE|eukprot:Cvel_10487.t1-p1 / transcript=Cvel_10487.t1 / gene=Cvel_10487 / organism=Chromera_velia_CCMP2878 / gene_product=hypothetical protein / transcript_product=hypothetical protein / location=Cvel_scaffold633:47908-61307(-) / protein_length=724 / sequence_SO=supercontig / SO=protein_coding / is_pseudo=false
MLMTGRSQGPAERPTRWTRAHSHSSVVVAVVAFCLTIPRAVRGGRLSPSVAPPQAKHGLSKLHWQSLFDAPEGTVFLEVLSSDSTSSSGGSEGTLAGGNLLDIVDTLSGSETVRKCFSKHGEVLIEGMSEREIEEVLSQDAESVFEEDEELQGQLEEDEEDSCATPEEPKEPLANRKARLTQRVMSTLKWTRNNASMTKVKEALMRRFRLWRVNRQRGRLAKILKPHADRGDPVAACFRAYRYYGASSEDPRIDGKLEDCGRDLVTNIFTPAHDEMLKLIYKRRKKIAGMILKTVIINGIIVATAAFPLALGVTAPLALLAIGTSSSAAQMLSNFAVNFGADIGTEGDRVVEEHGSWADAAEAARRERERTRKRDAVVNVLEVQLAQDVGLSTAGTAAGTLSKNAALLASRGAENVGMAGQNGAALITFNVGSRTGFEGPSVALGAVHSDPTEEAAARELVEEALLAEDPEETILDPSVQVFAHMATWEGFWGRDGVPSAAKQFEYELSRGNPPYRKRNCEPLGTGFFTREDQFYPEEKVNADYSSIKGISSGRNSSERGKGPEVEAPGGKEGKREGTLLGRSLRAVAAAARSVAKKAVGSLMYGPDAIGKGMAQTIATFLFNDGRTAGPGTLWVNPQDDSAQQAQSFTSQRLPLIKGFVERWAQLTWPVYGATLPELRKGVKALFVGYDNGFGSVVHACNELLARNSFALEKGRGRIQPTAER